MWGLATLAWPGLHHPAVVTTSDDGTARIWDPHQPDTELARLTLLGQGRGVTVIGAAQLALTTSRGFLIFDLAGDSDHHDA